MDWINNTIIAQLTSRKIKCPCTFNFLYSSIYQSFVQELAIHGTRITFCFSCRVDDAHQTSSEFLKYHPFSCCLRFSLLVCLLCLGKKAITCGFSYFLSYKCKWQSEMIFEKEREMMMMVLNNYKSGWHSFK